MPNKNSIESEIDKLLEEIPHLNRPEVYCRGKYGDSKSCDCYVSEIKQKLKNLIQREVKKGRVEEWERVLKAKVTHGGTPGFFNPEGLPIETSHTQQLTEVIQKYAKDRLEELENDS